MAQRIITQYATRSNLQEAFHPKFSAPQWKHLPELRFRYRSTDGTAELRREQNAARVYDRFFQNQPAFFIRKALKPTPLVYVVIIPDIIFIKVFGFQLYSR
jgi:hypothetical protein